MRLGAPLRAIAFTLALAAVLVAWAGAPVGRAYALLLEGGFGSRFALTETLTRATPLILTGLAAAVAFRAHLYNIGAEGQLPVPSSVVRTPRSLPRGSYSGFTVPSCVCQYRVSVKFAWVCSQGRGPIQV